MNPADEYREELSEELMWTETLGLPYLSPYNEKPYIKLLKEEYERVVK